jgi:hypothetical protein
MAAARRDLKFVDSDVASWVARPSRKGGRVAISDKKPRHADAIATYPATKRRAFDIGMLTDVGCNHDPPAESVFRSLRHAKHKYAMKRAGRSSS